MLSKSRHKVNRNYRVHNPSNRRTNKQKKTKNQGQKFGEISLNNQEDMNWSNKRSPNGETYNRKIQGNFSIKLNLLIILS